MISWGEELKIDPVPGLLSSGNEANKYFTYHDLLDEKSKSINKLWNVHLTFL